MKILLTGASGFIGQSFYKEACTRNYFIRCTWRDLNLKPSITASNSEHVEIGNINDKTNWKFFLSDIDCIIHCAAKAHILKKSQFNSLDSYRNINVEATKNLAIQAAKSGVKRLIFLSTIGVNGNFTKDRNVFDVNDTPKPIENYAISKFEAEEALKEVSNLTGLELVIIRAPLVYGPGAKGNFQRLLNLISKNIPLPFGRIKNSRSFVGIDNLVDLIICCIENTDAAKKTFLVSDGQDLSTTELINLIALSMGRSARLFPVPRALLKFFGFITRKQNEIEKLLESLQVDSTHTRKILNWKPPVSVEEGIRRMVQGK